MDIKDALEFIEKWADEHPVKTNGPSLYAAAKTLADAIQQGAVAMPDFKYPQIMEEGLAAEFLGLAPGTLSVWRSTGRYSVPFLKVGRNVRYRRADLEKWLCDRTQTQTSNATGEARPE